MNLIDEFIARYRKEFDYYDQAARIVSQLVEQNLQSAGIRAMVTFRAKSPSRLEPKVKQRNRDKHYKTVEDIYRDIVDLAGVRIALYFPAERDQVGKLIRQLFAIEGEPKEFPASSKPSVSYDKRFSGYWATHYRVRLRDSSLNDAQKRYGEALVEIQVASVVMHAWAEVNHDLVYKPMQGQLSQDEYAILDELNGLVMAGEIALERLQRAGETRVAALGRVFSSHYDLASYLLDQADTILRSNNPDALLGRVDVLFEMLSASGLATPDQLRPYLVTLTHDFEQRPLSEQIIDQLLAQNPALYQTYNDLRTQISAETGMPPAPKQIESQGRQLAMGNFLSRWIEFERRVRKLAATRFPDQRFPFPTYNMLKTLELFDNETLHEIDGIRRLRNNMVHGIELPAVADIDDAGRRLNLILKNLPKGSKPRQKRR